MSVYTKRGDDGYTSILKGKRMAKNSKVFSVLGSVDEVNSYLGIVISDMGKGKTVKFLSSVQENLFRINAIVAGADIAFSSQEVKKMEELIDNTERKLPVLSNFVLPGGDKTAAELFYARTLVRKAERELVALKAKSDNSKSDIILRYINRLSDVLFVMARWENFKSRKKEIVWKAK